MDDYWIRSNYKLKPTDSDMFEYLKRKIYSKYFSLPMWRVHEVVDFCDRKPQELSEKYDAARDGNWYFVTSTTPVRTIKSVAWKATDVNPRMNRRIFKDGRWLGFKFSFEFLDENNQKWLMCLYRAPDFVNRKLSEWTLGKIYKHIEDEDEEEEEEEEGEGEGEEGYAEGEEVPKDDVIHTGAPNDSLIASPFKFGPTDSDMIAYLKRKIESENFSLPRWRVHEVVDFCDYKPQKLSEKYDAARDGNWYFITSITPIRTINSVAWKATDREPFVDRRVFKDGKWIGFKFCFEFLDENNQKWLMCLYRVPLPGFVTNLNKWTFGKIYKHIEEEEEEEEEEELHDESDAIYIVPYDADADADADDRPDD